MIHKLAELRLGKQSLRSVDVTCTNWNLLKLKTMHSNENHCVAHLFMNKMRKFWSVLKAFFDKSAHSV